MERTKRLESFRYRTRESVVCGMYLPTLHVPTYGNIHTAWCVCFIVLGRLLQRLAHHLWVFFVSPDMDAGKLGHVLRLLMRLIRMMSLPCCPLFYWRRRGPDTTPLTGLGHRVHHTPLGVGKWD